MSTVILSNIPYHCQVSDVQRALLMYGTAVDVQFNQQTSQAIVCMRTPMEAQALLSRREVNICGCFVRVERASSNGTPLPNMNSNSMSNPNMRNEMGSMNGMMMHNAPHQHQSQHQMPSTQRGGYSSYNNNGASMGGYHAAMNPNYASDDGYCGGNHVANGDYNHSSFHRNDSYNHNTGSGYNRGYPNNGDGGGGPTNRLSIIVEDCRYPITRDVLFQMFSMVGPTKQIYCGPSGPVTTGSVEFHDVAMAERAMQQFNHNNIYPGCCFVKLSYEQPSYPFQGGGRGGTVGPQGPIIQPPPQFNSNNVNLRGNDIYQGGSRGGMPMRGRGGRGGRGGGYGCENGGNAFSPMGNYSQPHRGPMVGGRGLGPLGGPPAPQGFAVFINNVSETTPLQDLWILLEVYGNVLSLKRMLKARTNVVAMFQNGVDAKNAVFYLNNCPFRGSTLNLKQFAGYVETCSMTQWNTGPATDPATQAVRFTVGFHHRTKPSHSINIKGRVRPDRNLYITNLMADVSEEDVRAEFGKGGCEVELYYRRADNIAIVSFKDVEIAVNALISTHSKQVKGRYLRITFSRFKPGPRPEGEVEQDDEDGNPMAGAEGEAVDATPTDAPAEDVTPAPPGGGEPPAPAAPVSEVPAEVSSEC